MEQVNWEEACPSLRILTLHKGQKTIDYSFGESFSHYDIASLTKIVFTNSLLMHAKSNSQIDLQKPISHYLDAFSCGDLKVSDFLCHRSGMDWWKSFYLELLPDLSVEIDHNTQWAKLAKILKEERPKLVERAVYSDIDYFLLALVLMKIYDTDLLKLWNDLSLSLDMKQSFFSVNNVCPIEKSLVAPTEYCQWRNAISQGIVHDENAYSLGGVSTHAGLFSTVDDLAQWCKKIRSCLLEGETSFWKPEVLREFTTRQMPKEFGDWAMGFMMPTEGKASCGQYFSEKSFGHTGFTGTSIWFEPEKDLIAIVLSNRVHPSRENKKFVGLRAFIHDQIYLSHFGVGEGNGKII